MGLPQRLTRQGCQAGAVRVLLPGMAVPSPRHRGWRSPVAPCWARWSAGCAAGVGADAAACWTAGVTAWCAVWWVLEPIPVPVTSLVPWCSRPRVLDQRAVATAYGHP